MGHEPGQKDKEWAFALDGNTRIDADGKTRSASELRAGDIVTVSYATRDGKIIAQNVKVKAAAPLPDWTGPRGRFLAALPARRQRFSSYVSRTLGNGPGSYALSGAAGISTMEAGPFALIFTMSRRAWKGPSVARWPMLNTIVSGSRFLTSW